MTKYSWWRAGEPKVRIRPLALLCIGVLAVSAFVAAAPADVPVPAIPPDHPRVYIRPADIPALQTKISLPEFSNIWNAIVSGAGSPSQRGSQTCSALIYLLTGDTTYGRKAIDEAIPIIQASTEARRFHEPFHYLSMVYDWCYDLMTAQEKQDFITEFIRLASSHGPWYPAVLTAGSVVGHDTEGWLLTDQLPAGIAIYDENQIMYDAAAQLFFQKFAPARNYLYPGHWHHQGDSYTATRFTHDAASAWLFRRLGAGDVYTSEVQYLPYQLIYNLRPDGQQIRTGDTYDDCGNSHKKGLMCDLVGSYFNDPYLLEMADANYFYDGFPLYKVFEFIFREPGYTRSPISQLPLTKYFPHPAGEMVARTGWTISGSSTDALIWMRIGKTFFGNHQKRDFGTFQIYYRGAQALATGLYEGSNSGYGSDHWKCYYHQTISCNGLLIYDPSEPMVTSKRPVNDGGQRMPSSDHPRDLDILLTPAYQYGNVSSHQFGPDPIGPEYSYIAGDITDAYSNKVSQVTRSMVALNLADPTYPAALVVFDRVTSTNPTFKKTWLLHSITEPTVAGRTITQSRNQGKLVAESLLPAQATLTKVGGTGKQFWVESSQTNYYTTKGGCAEAGAWRVEVSPDAAAMEDEFLHVMTVMDSTTVSGPVVTMIEGTGIVAATLLDRVVIFDRDGASTGPMQFTTPGPGEQKILVCDLAPGWWVVQNDDKTFYQVCYASDEGRCIYFAGPADDYTLRRIQVQTHVFYNNSAFDGSDPAANAADDGAIATDKTALLPGETASFANYTSYARGINGVMVDIENLPGTPTAADFVFKVGNDSSPGGWSAAPAPSGIDVRAGQGANGSDRITIIWADNAIQKQWLQVTVLATANTGLSSPDVFYFGNAIGETGNFPSDAEVTPTDEVAVRNSPHTLALSPAAIDDNCDFNRDRKVGPTDAIIVRDNGTSGPTALQLITAP